MYTAINAPGKILKKSESTFSLCRRRPGSFQHYIFEVFG